MKPEIGLYLSGISYFAGKAETRARVVIAAYAMGMASQEPSARGTSTVR